MYQTPIRQKELSGRQCCHGAHAVTTLAHKQLRHNATISRKFTNNSRKNSAQITFQRCQPYLRSSGSRFGWELGRIRRKFDEERDGANSTAKQERADANKETGLALLNGAHKLLTRVCARAGRGAERETRSNQSQRLGKGPRQKK